LWNTWRSYALHNTIDATLTHVGLQNYLPGSNDAITGFKFLLDSFPVLQGKGASGLPFFNATGAPNPAAARDFVLLGSLKNALDQLASAAMAPAFGGSTNQSDYRWGQLHRIVFDHPLGGPFSIPGQDGFTSPYGFTDLASNLPGISRGGAWQTVNVGDFNMRGTAANDFMFGSGPARRFVGEMNSTISANEVIPGGNSAVLGSPNYADQLPLWLTNQYHPLAIPAAAAIAQAKSELDFQPAH
jgi:penicillin amidase